MKLVFIGCVNFSYTTLEYIIEQNFPKLSIIGIVTKEESKFNSDFKSLEPLGKKNNIPVFIVKGNNQEEMGKWIIELGAEIIFCFGWSYLLKNNILKIPIMGVIGYHPAMLPKNRGRHPIIWALALGLSQTASTFFFMDEGADSGDILNQKKVSIQLEDDANSLYQKLQEIALEQISEFMPQLIEKIFERQAQNHSKANYWRKRGKQDGKIDWRMSAKLIYNLIRALTYPYIGAHFLYNDKEIKVWKSEIASITQYFDNIEPGKVISIQNKKITIKCGEGAITLLDHEIIELPKEGMYL